MRFGSVCSGIEAASVAWEPLGWKAAWFSEIEPFPSAVLADHYPDTPNHGDMTTLPARILAGEVEAPDLFCGGTPCQAFSVAGLRRSLDDERGNLSLTFVEIADAIDDVRRARGDAECIVFWENVPGVLSTKDNAFGCFLGALAGCDTAIEPLAATGWTDAGVVAGPQRTVAWRVLDAQYFGLAQRRRRVFVVASAREGFDPAAVLLEWEGVRRDSAPSREAGKVAPTIPSRSTAGGGLGTDFDCDGGVVRVCPTLRAGGNSTGGDRPPGTDVDTADSLQVVQSYPVGNTLTARMHKGINSTLDEGQPPVLAHALRGEGFDASEHGTGRGTPLVPVAHVDTMPTMLNGANTPAGHNARSGHTKDQYIVPMAFAKTHKPMSETDPEGWTPVDASPTITHWPRDRSDTGTDVAVVQPVMQVRRLTPVECERLQGFPDGYTAIPWRGKPASECPDGPRYKALGNSWAVPCVRWIGRRIAAQIA